MDQELSVIEADVLADLTTYRDPVAVLDEARAAAVALKDVLDKKSNKVMMGGEQYLEFEDWQTVAHFYGCSAKVVATSYVTYGTVSGFEAKAVAFHMGSGKEIAAAESMCLNDEEKWSARNKYEWAYVKKSGGHSVEDPGPAELIWVDNPRQPGRKAPKKEKIQVGVEAVPLFQLKSMAQTRACAKALRNAFAWVVVLAGYRPTPAEELPNAVVVPQVEHSGIDAASPHGGKSSHEPGMANVSVKSPDQPKGTVLEPSVKDYEADMGKSGEGSSSTSPLAGLVSQPLAPVAEQAAGATDDPATPYRRKIIMADDEKACQAAYNATPEPLKQEVHGDYFDTLKRLSKRKK